LSGVGIVNVGRGIYACPEVSGPGTLCAASGIVPPDDVIEQTVPVNGDVMRFQQADCMAQVYGQIVAMGIQQSDESSFDTALVGLLR